MSIFNGKEIWISGGVGSLGKTLTKILLTKYTPRGIRLYSRDEYKQWKFKNELKNLDLLDKVAFIIGDIRDLKSTTLSMKGVDIAVNCAAMKQIPICEANPIQAINTNIVGSLNVALAALETKPSKVMHVGTDKDCHPVNLYGATKMCAEKLFIHSGVYTGGRTPHFACCRYGNVLASRGSIIPLFKEQIEQNIPITITHQSMTRFWISLPKVAQFLLDCIERMNGGEVFIPKMPSAKVTDIALALSPDAQFVYTGIRKGEKMHEELISIEEGMYTKIHDTYYEINMEKIAGPSFAYNSRNNPDFMNIEQVKKMLEEITE